jgi:membrane protease YdiL (CAAX protease family)
MKIETTIFILLACYSLMFVTVVGFERLRAGNSLLRSDLRVLNYLHVALISLMLVTSCIIKAGYFLLQFPDKITLEQLAAFLMVFGAISFLPWKKFSKEVTVGQYVSGQPASRIALYTLLRTGFLVIYEWFFRGLLLLSFSEWLGITWAIVVNVFLYAMLHANKSKKEMFGSVPLGVIMCVFTLWWQSIWPAIIFHVQLVIVNEWPLLQKAVSLQKQNAI